MSFFTPLTSDQIDNLLVTEFVRAYQELAPGQPVPSTNVGATLGAAFRSVRMLTLQIQNNQSQIQSTARLQTSTGGDVTSFMEPFDVAPLPASPSSGTVTFATASSPSAQVVIPVGTIVQTTGGITFTVVADNDQPGYSAGAAPGGGYVIPAAANPFTVDASVVCNFTGTVGNVPANTIIVPVGNGSGPVPAIATVTNSAGFTNGTDTESESASKARFTLEVSGQHSGTNNAIAAAITGVQSGLTYSIGDLTSTTGAVQVAPQTTTTGAVAIPAVNSSATFPLTGSNIFPFGAFVVVFDGTRAFYGQVTNLVDATHVGITNLQTLVGSGTMSSGATVLFVGSLAYFTSVVNVLGQSSGPSAALLNAVNAAIDGVVAAGTTYWVIPPTLVPVNVSATLHIPSNADSGTVIAAAQAAVQNFINNIGLDPAGNTTICAYGKIYAVLYGVPNVSNVDALTVNSGTSDVTAAFAHQLVAGSTLTFTTVSP